MKRIILFLAAMAAALQCWTGCSDVTPTTTPTPTPGEGTEGEPSYENMDAYEPLKSYVNRSVSPDFKLGVAVTVPEFLKQGKEYAMAVENFDEMTAGNAMKQASVMKPDGSMDFTQVKDFISLASRNGMTVYGHTLAWHSQQQNAYLNGLLKGHRVELPSDEREDMVLFETDFEDGKNPFLGWGNNSSRTVENGALKLSNPSAVQNWEVQFAMDFGEPFEQDQEYVLKFRIKGSSKGKISAGFQILDGSYTSAGEFSPVVEFDTQWKDVEMSCVCKASGGTRLVFSFGEFAGDIHIDDFEFIEKGASYKYEPLTDEEKKAVLTDALDRWIKGMMEATAQDVSAWDVVNEPVSGRDVDGDGYYELESAQWGDADKFYWQDYLGAEDYVRIVVAKTRQYYSEYGGTEPLRLFINDYNLESDWDDNRKVKSLIRWIEIWESDGVTRIDGIGTQMHISYYENPDVQSRKEEHVVKMLQLMADTGKLVKISELDMGYVDRNGNALAASSLTEQQHKAMADYYRFIVSKYFEIVPPAQQYGITQWCPTDSPGTLGTGWRGGEPTGLWDQSFNRKYAYAGFADGLRNVR